MRLLVDYCCRHATKCRTLMVVLIILLRIAFIGAQPARPTPSVPSQYAGGSNPCYGDQGVPQRCVPDFINAAFNLPVEVTNTCGQNGPTHFCMQTGHSGARKVCDICDARIEAYAHPASYLTDFNVVGNETHWQSETMLENIQYPTTVNLTLRLEKKFDITYVRIKFISPRPESFVIYRLVDSEPNTTWSPWQYYSGSCRSTFGLPERAPILPGNEAIAQCTKEFSDISPLTGADIAFSTLEGRPSSQQFEESEVLQEWVTTEAIKIELKRLNTFGDEVFQYPQVLQSYYYAISDIAVGGRCKCNGHASECVKSTGEGGDKLVCRCEHDTEGADCQKCKPFYNDRPWRQATSTDANECRACNCNSLASRCYFDNDLFEATGSGGHCIDCTGNTQGAHCEECLPNNWRRPGEHYCVQCRCNEIGSLSLQCDSNGQCPCKPGVDGQFCDRCKPGFYEFGANGCKDCLCDKAGSFNNQPQCSASTGDCACKLNVEGRQCDRCKPGYFDLSNDNQFGCTPCFCFGHSSICTTATGYFAVNISSDFSMNKNKWSGISARGQQDAQWAEIDKAVAISSVDDTPVYFLAPSQFLGDQRASYNQDLVFILRVHNNNARPSVQDIIITGADGQELSIPIFAQSNPNPSSEDQVYRFRIHANQQYQWSPRLNEIDFIGVLSNITSLKIRGTFSSKDVGFLSSVNLGSASLAPSSLDPRKALWVEVCDCLPGFVGQFCESCEPGFRREIKFGGPFNRCVKCDCHGHSDSCEAESGACICEHNTSGDTCERCARGYYGNALLGTANDCEKCPCPEEGPCILHTDGDVICTDCPTGYSGRRCDICADGFFGEPKENKSCRECECSGNIDANSIGNCDSITGECKKCIYNTHGFNCEKCEKGFWGDALLVPKGDCKACRCYAPGTRRPSIDYTMLECRQSDGQCDCQPHVIGSQCNQCEAGYFNLTSGIGCQECNCDALGSMNSTCDVATGQCICKAGVTGRRCDQCAPRQFGFGIDGCKSCECEAIGSESPQCDVKSGQCLCREHIEGRQCDKCVENRYNIRSGCLQCDECYTLIQRRVNEFRDEVGKLQKVLKEIIDNPVQINDTDFDMKLKEVEQQVNELSDLVQQKLAGDDSALVGKVNKLREDLNEAVQLLMTVDETIKSAGDKAENTKQMLSRWNVVKDRAIKDLDNAQKFLETEGKTNWELAQEAAKRYGDQSQQLSGIASAARKLADEQDMKSAEIEKIGMDALNASKVALAEAKEAIFGGASTSQQIANLENQLSAAEDVYNKTLQQSTEQLDAAAKANKLAAEALTTVDALKLPNVDIDKLTKDAERIKEDAKMANDNANEQAGGNKELIDESTRVAADARHQFQRAEEQQKVADELLAEVDAAKAKSLAAVELAENTLKEANATLYTLIDFDKLVEESKLEAIKELENIKEIESQIQIAEQTTQDAESALGNAQADAKSAEEIAERAQNEANDVSQKARDLKNETIETKKSAATMKVDATELDKAIDQATATLENYQKQAQTDKIRASDAVTSASKAEKAAKTTNKTIVDASEKIKLIIDQLNSLDTVSTTELDELENQLADATKTLDEANLEKEVQSLKDKQIDQQRRISSYKMDIDELMKEVRNIEQVRDSLPHKCFNVVSLEQEGQ